MKLDDDNYDYYIINYDLGINKDVTLTRSIYIKNIHSHVVFNESETITGDYYFDLDKYQCVTYSFVFYNDKDELVEGTPETICDDKKEITYIAKNFTYYIMLKFVDIDYLESIEVVEFDAEYSKIDNYMIDVTSNDIPINISKDTSDLLLNMKYIDANGEPYYVRELINRSKIESKANKMYNYSTISLNQNNERQIITLKFTTETEGETA